MECDIRKGSIPERESALIVHAIVFAGEYTPRMRLHRLTDGPPGDLLVDTNHVRMLKAEGAK